MFRRSITTKFKLIGPKPLLLIAKYLDYRAVVRLRAVSKHLRGFIDEHLDELEKLPVDQVSWIWHFISLQ